MQNSIDKIQGLGSFIDKRLINTLLEIFKTQKGGDNSFFKINITNILLVIFIIILLFMSIIMIKYIYGNNTLLYQSPNKCYPSITNHNYYLQIPNYEKSRNKYLTDDTNINKKKYIDMGKEYREQFLLL